MPFGLRVTNESSIVQIDGDYDNLEILQSGTVSSTAQKIYYPGSEDYSNLVFVRPQVDGVQVTNYGTYPGGTPGVGIHPAGIYFMLTTLNAGTPARQMVDYVVVSRSSAVVRPAPSYGLQVFNPAGGVAFESSRRYLKIVHTFYAPVGDPYPAPVVIHTVDLPPPSPGKKYYVLLNTLLQTSVDATSGGTDTYGYAATFISPTRLQVKPREYLEWAGAQGLSKVVPPDMAPCIMVAEF